MGQECYNPINVQVNGFLSLPHLVSTRMVTGISEYTYYSVVAENGRREGKGRYWLSIARLCYGSVRSLQVTVKLCAVASGAIMCGFRVLSWGGVKQSVGTMFE